MRTMIRFARRTPAAVFLAGALCAAGCSSPGGALVRAGDRPHIILITVESLRTDRLGCYGGASNLTPEIDRLAARGVRFERAYTASPSTVPAVASILTGLEPPRHGLRDDLGGRLRDGVATVASILRDDGYRTGAVVSTSYLDSDRGLDRGFSFYDDTFRSPSRAGPVPAVERPAEEALEVALEFIGSDAAASPFFLWIDFYDPHWDHAAPTAAAAGPGDDPYGAEVAHVDAQIGALVKALDERGLLARTFIGLAGTHGEGLGDHGETGHGIYLHETTIRVPLILAPPAKPAGPADDGIEPGGPARTDGSAEDAEAPGVGAGGGGGTVRTPVGLVDLAPTFLEVSGREAPGRMTGRSLLDPALRKGAMPPDESPGGGDRRGRGNRRIVIESLQPHAAYGWAPLFAVVEGDRKVVAGGRLEAFDLGPDPEGRRPLQPAPAWAADLERAGREAIGPTGVTPGEREEILATVEKLDLPWANSPICLEKEEFPDPRDRVPLNDALFRARTLHHQGVRGTAGDMADEILDEDPVNFAALVMSIESATLRGIQDREEEGIQLLQCNYPLRAAPYHLYAHMRMDAMQMKEAEAPLRMFARLTPWSEEPDYDLAILFAGTGDTGRALDHLERSIALGATNFSFIRSDPRLAALRGDPRFEELLGAGGGPDNPSR